MRSLLVELLVEELPPKALEKLGQVFADELAQQLRQLGLASADSVVSAFATPRRLAAHISHVVAKAADQVLRQKLMPVRVGLDENGLATPALLKKLQALGLDVLDPALLCKDMDGKTETLFYARQVSGVSLDVGLQQALTLTLARLPIPKLMSYQLESDCDVPGWSSVHFVRPARALLALHGDTVVPIKVLGLRAGRSTQGHRFEAARSPLLIADADSYVETLLHDGAVIASFAQRQAAIVAQIKAAASALGAGVHAVEDQALLDEVTALVERPHVLCCQFEPEFLRVPQECLILTMKANQKYFPLLDGQNKLMHQFLLVSNISPSDSSAVVAGNERVVRARLADAGFFYDQDRKKSLASRLQGLDKVVYHNKLGSQAQRTARVSALACAIAQRWQPDCLPDDQQGLVYQVELAARLAKADLLTDMVAEFPELQGVMGAYYARNDGLSLTVAQAIEDHYKPRFAGDELARNPVGVVLALADKLETLVGLFGIDSLPSGDKDPFALRRCALGVIRLWIEKDLPLALTNVLQDALQVFGAQIKDPSAVLLNFIFERLAGFLREQGYSALEVEAVLVLRQPDLAQIPRRLAALRSFTALAEAPALAAANKRISNILKKTDAAVVADAHVSQVLLQEEAEIALYAAMQDVVAQAQPLLQAGNYSAYLQALAALRAPVDRFFDQVMVNDEALDLRLNRLGLLKTLHLAMNRVADLSRLTA